MFTIRTETLLPELGSEKSAAVLAAIHDAAISISMLLTGTQDMSLTIKAIDYDRHVIHHPNELHRVKLIASLSRPGCVRAIRFFWMRAVEEGSPFFSFNGNAAITPNEIADDLMMLVFIPISA